MCSVFLIILFVVQYEFSLARYYLKDQSFPEAIVNTW